MCLSLDEKIRAKEVVTELDGIGRKITSSSKPQGSGEATFHSYKQEQLLNLHSSLIKELQVFIEKC